MLGKIYISLLIALTSASSGRFLAATDNQCKVACLDAGEEYCVSADFVTSGACCTAAATDAICTEPTKVCSGNEEVSDPNFPLKF